MKILLFDTETTGLPKSREPANNGPGNWPHLVSIAWTLLDTSDAFHTILTETHIVKPLWDIPEDSVKIHGITHAKATADGIPLSSVVEKFLAIEHDMLIAHNMNFDYNVLVNAIRWDLKLAVLPDFKPRFCTMEAMRPVMCLPAANGRGYKSPKLTELYTYVVKKPFDTNKLHSAQYDTWMLASIIKESTVLHQLLGLRNTPDESLNANKKARHTLVL